MRPNGGDRRGHLGAPADLPATLADVEAELAAPYLPPDERKALEQLRQQLLDKRAADASVLTELQQKEKAADLELKSAPDPQARCGSPSGRG